uniref:Ionotropic receptor 22 n=1 Tax=Propsilocerus akamusi TaxID=903466 RepID=A0A7D0PAL5_9DIPT|nr:ionotropic receptor 22 [Propsilocerus akamusi]
MFIASEAEYSQFGTRFGLNWCYRNGGRYRLNILTLIAILYYLYLINNRQLWNWGLFFLRLLNSSNLLNHFEELCLALSASSLFIFLPLDTLLKQTCDMSFSQCVN